jgi:hypothetical protein
VLFNAADHDVEFRIPSSPTARWRIILNTAEDDSAGEFGISDPCNVTARSLLLMEAVA